jgi:hypothetical protein
MKDVFAKLASDFFSTIVFLVLWAIYVSAVASGAKVVAAFAVQFVAFRMLIKKRLRAAATAAPY